MNTQFQSHYIIVKCLNMHENFFYSRMTLPDWKGALKSSFWRVLMPFHRFWKGELNHGIFNGRRFWTWWAVWRAVLSPVARLSNQRDVCLQRDSRRRGPTRRHPGLPGWRNVESTQIDAFSLLANVQGKGDSLCTKTSANLNSNNCLTLETRGCLHLFCPMVKPLRNYFCDTSWLHSLISTYKLNLRVLW